MSEDETIAQFDAFIRRDPAQRGLIGSEPRFGPLCPGNLAGASAHLAEFGRKVAIVTGFFIPGGDPPSAETDGPPGALLLAQALQRVGIDVVIVTDRYCGRALAAAAQACAFPVERLLCYPHSDEDATDGGARSASSDRLTAFAASLTGLTHLIAIERVGPSHTLESFVAQPRAGEPPVALFEEKVPPARRDHCHNMRGENIDAFAGDLHRLFEQAARLFPAAKTIGIGDGGNEIGMGAVPWEDLERRLSGEQSGRVPCRIACDWNIVAGTSNWGGMALAAGVVCRRGQPELLRPFTVAQQRLVLEAMVVNGPAVDGVTRRREATVDGIPFLTYIQPWEGMRRALGLDQLA